VIRLLANLLVLLSALRVPFLFLDMNRLLIVPLIRVKLERVLRQVCIFFAFGGQGRVLESVEVGDSFCYFVGHVGPPCYGALVVWVHVLTAHKQILHQLCLILKRPTRHNLLPSNLRPLIRRSLGRVHTFQQMHVGPLPTSPTKCSLRPILAIIGVRTR